MLLSLNGSSYMTAIIRPNRNDLTARTFGFVVVTIASVHFFTTVPSLCAQDTGAEFSPSDAIALPSPVLTDVDAQLPPPSIVERSNGNTGNNKTDRKTPPRIQLPPNLSDRLKKSPAEVAPKQVPTPVPSQVEPIDPRIKSPQTTPANPNPANPSTGKATGPRTPNSPSAGLVAVDVQKATLVNSLESQAFYSGIIKPNRKSELSFERSGRIEQIDIDEGERVVAGQVLARLNTDQLQAQVRKLQADRRAAEAVLTELKAGPRQEVIDSARASVREQQVQWDLALANLQRRERLWNERLISREELEQARTAVERWHALYDAAQKKLEDIELGTRTEKIQSQEAAIEAFDAAIATIQVDIEHSELRSPYAGAIISRRVDEGHVASAGSPVFVLSEDQVLLAHFGVPPTVVQALHVGDEVKVQVREQTISGTIKWIIAQVDENTRSQDLAVSLQSDAESRVVAGDIARLEVVRRQEIAGYWMDTSAVNQGQRGLWECFVVEPEKSGDLGVVVKRSVEILHTEGDRVLVRGAIQPDELVVTSGVHRLTVGQRVKPILRSTP